MSGRLLSMFGGGGSNIKFYTLNFDGSHNNQANESGAGCIIRDNHGELVVAAAYNLTVTYPDYCDVAIAEAIALRNGLILAKDHSLNVKFIKGDSKEVIDHVLRRSRRPSRPRLSQIILEIKNNMDPFSDIECIDREANEVADKLALWGRRKLLGVREIYTTYADLPPQVADLIELEKTNNSRTELDGEDGSSMAKNMVMAGAAVAGVALLTWGVSKLIFGGESSSDQQQNNKAKAPWNNVIDAAYNLSSRSPQNNDYYTLNFDGSDINQLQKGGAGCIIRNKQGDLVIAAAYNLDNLYTGQFHVAIAEAIVLQKGLNLAKVKRVKLDLIKGDSTEVIERILGQEKKAPRVPFLSKIICEIKEGLYEQSIDPAQVKIIGREANKVANELATVGSKLEFGTDKTYVKNEDLTFKLAQLIQRDKKLLK